MGFIISEKYQQVKTKKFKRDFYFLTLFSPVGSCLNNLPKSYIAHKHLNYINFAELYNRALRDIVQCG